MKTVTIETVKGEEVITLYYSSLPSGYGHYKISCDVDFNGEKTTISHTTSNMSLIDSISELKANDASFEEVQNYYHDEVYQHIEDRLIEWVDGVIENQEVE